MTAIRAIIDCAEIEALRAELTDAVMMGDSSRLASLVPRSLPVTGRRSASAPAS